MLEPVVYAVWIDGPLGVGSCLSPTTADGQSRPFIYSVLGRTPSENCGIE